MAIALPWDYATGLAAATAVTGLVMARTDRPRLQSAARFCDEAAIVIGLYALWQLAGRLSVTGSGGARGRAAWIEQAQHALHFPSEAGMQHMILGAPLVVQCANIYYATVHFPATGALLLWMYFRHRRHYRHVRTTVALTTFICLVVQLMPVAPPRLMPGFVDTAALYGQSVYGTGFGADQLSAMPSMHVAWAGAVGFYVWRFSTSRWRWVGPAHGLVTVWVVLVTANHWWLDGVAAVAALVVGAWLARAATGLLRVLRSDRIDRRHVAIG